MTSDRPALRISSQAWWSLLALGVALLLIGKYGETVLAVSLIVFGAALLTLAIRPAAELLRRRAHLPRGVTIAIAYITIAGTIVAVAILLIPIISADVAVLRDRGPALVESIVSKIPPRIRESDVIDQAAATLGTRLSETAVGAARFATRVAALAVDGLVILVLALFFTLGGRMGERTVDAWFPANRRPRARLILKRTSDRLTRWVWAQLAAASFFAVVFGSALLILGVPFAISIALIAFVLEFVPYLGAVTALVLSTVSALTVSPWLAVWTLVVYAAVALFHGHVIIPLFSGRAGRIHPALVLVALIFGAKTGGVIGMLFAVPLAVVIVALLEEFRAAEEGESAARGAGPSEEPGAPPGVGTIDPTDVEPPPSGP